jgi:hypothetical protein
MKINSIFLFFLHFVNKIIELLIQKCEKQKKMGTRYEIRFRLVKQPAKSMNSDAVFLFQQIKNIICVLFSFRLAFFHALCFVLFVFAVYLQR